MSQQEVADCLRKLGPANIHAIVAESGCSKAAAAWSLLRMKRCGEVIYHKEGRSGKWELVK